MIKHKKQKGRTREYFEAITVAFVVVMILRVSIVQAYHVPTGSMKSTVLEGDYLLVNKFIYGIHLPDTIPFTGIDISSLRLPAFKEPRQGEIVVFKYPRNPSLNYVKRCIAVGGQVVEIRDGLTYVDGQPEGKSRFVGITTDEKEGAIRNFKITRLDGSEYSIRHYQHTSAEMLNMGPIQVPKDHFFMMGDNRDNSSDSRHWGFVPRKNIVGEAMLVYWSTREGHPFYDVLGKIRWPRVGKVLN